MKKLIFILFCFFTQSGFGQNWAFFPLNQKTYYRSADTTELYEMLCDSVLISGDTTFYLIYSKPSFPELECVATIDAANFDSYSAIQNMPSYRIGNWIYTISDYGENEIFKLNIDTVIESSWTITNDNGEEVDQITITYDSSGIVNVFGIDDSIKYYSVHTTSPMNIEFALDSVVIKLTKSFGFIEFPHLYHLVSGENGYYDTYPPFVITGYITETDSVGFYAPQNWLDFIQLHPGDVLKYRWQSGYDVEYYTKTILGIDKSEDKIEITYLNDLDQEETEIYYRNALQYVLPFRGNTFMYGPMYPNDSTYVSNAFHDGPTVSDLANWSIDKMMIEEGWTLNKSYENIRWQYDEDDCNFDIVMGVGTNTYINSYVGVSYFDYGDYDYTYYYQLIGGIIDGHTWGNYWPVSIEEQFVNDLTTTIHPNPADEIIYIDAAGIFDYAIYCLNGQLIKKGITANNRISIEELTKGFYLIELQTEDEILRGKFIKL